MQPLAHISVLVTRPAAEGEALIKSLKAAGATAVNAPMLRIVGPEDAAQAKRVASSVSADDVVIFVSRNAAKFGVPLLAAADFELGSMKAYAVGPGTAAELESQAVGEIVTPLRDYNSEGLLALEELARHHLRQRRVVIFRGLGGRETLGQELSRRAAALDYCECYRRQRPDIELSALLAASKVKIPDIAVLTSVEALKNLCLIIKNEGLERLFGMKIAVIGSRIGREVAALGFTRTPLIIENPSDDSIISRLIEWAETEL